MIAIKRLCRREILKKVDLFKTKEEVRKAFSGFDDYCEKVKENERKRKASWLGARFIVLD